MSPHRALWSAGHTWQQEDIELSENKKKQHNKPIAHCQIWKVWVMHVSTLGSGMYCSTPPDDHDQVAVWGAYGTNYVIAHWAYCYQLSSWSYARTHARTHSCTHARTQTHLRSKKHTECRYQCKHINSHMLSTVYRVCTPQAKANKQYRTKKTKKTNLNWTRDVMYWPRDLTLHGWVSSREY